MKINNRIETAKMCLTQPRSDDNTPVMNDETERLRNAAKQRLNECITLLKESAKTLGERLTNSDDVSTIETINSENYVQELGTKLEKIESPQIRMPIIAPLSAGKSTILNAIIGEDILPTGALKMTALPTAIVIKLEQNAPSNVPPVELYLDKEILNGLQNLVINAAKHLRNYCKHHRELNSLLQGNSDLVRKAQEIRDSTGSVLAFQELLDEEGEATRGRKQFNNGMQFDNKKQIQFLLTFMNELVLICVYLASEQPDSSLSLVVFEDHIPWLLVNKCPLQNSQHQLKKSCQLVLIDTPGPSEARISAQLSSIVEHQLKVADVVCDIAEFSQLDTEANADVANDVDKIRSLKHEEDSIYVLLSKIDLYKRRNMSKEQLKQHIADFYKVSDKHVFLLSGSYALIAQQFFAEYEQSIENASPIHLQSSETAKDVLEAYCPCDWEAMLNKSSPEEVHKIAENLFKLSNLGIFLNSAIESVYGQVLHKCIESGLNTCTNVAKNFITAVRMRFNGLELMKRQLREEIDGLNQDLHDLLAVHDDHPSIIAGISNTLETELKPIFQQALQDLKEVLNKIFDYDHEIWRNSEEIERQDKLAKKAQVYNITFTSIFGTGLGAAASKSGASDWTVGIALAVGTFLGSIAIAVCMEYFNGNDDEILFGSVEDADEFIIRVSNAVNKVTQSIYETVKTSVNEAINKATTAFSNFTNEKTKPILDRVSVRLSNAFHVDFSPPKYLHKNHKTFILNAQNVRYMRKSMLWSLYTLINKSDATYFVSRTKLQAECVNNIYDSLKQIQEHIAETTSTDMKENFLAHLQYLQIYIEKYKHYVEQFLKDKHLEQENQKNFKIELHQLENKWIKYTKYFDELTLSINWTKLFPNTINSLSNDITVTKHHVIM